MSLIVTQKSLLTTKVVFYWSKLDNSCVQKKDLIDSLTKAVFQDGSEKGYSSLSFKDVHQDGHWHTMAFGWKIHFESKYPTSLFYLFYLQYLSFLTHSYFRLAVSEDQIILVNETSIADAGESLWENKFHVSPLGRKGNICGSTFQAIFGRTFINGVLLGQKRWSLPNHEVDSHDKSEELEQPPENLHTL